MEVYTHRGIGLGPENTHAAFRAAAALGVHLEGDIGRTKNGTLVMLHDETLDRTTNGTGLLREKTDEEIALLSAGIDPKTNHAEPIPLLKDILAIYGPHVKLDLDMKEDIGNEVFDLVTAYNLLPTVLFSSVDLKMLQDVKDRNPAAITGLVVEDCTPKQVPLLARAGVDVLKPSTKIASKDLFLACQDNGMGTRPWFYGNQRVWNHSMSRTIDRIAALGAEEIIVNHPHQVLNQLNRRQQLPPQAA